MFCTFIVVAMAAAVCLDLAKIVYSSVENPSHNGTSSAICDFTVLRTT